MYKKNSQSGFVHLLIVLILGLIAFLVITNIVNSKDGTFASLFSRSPLHAAELTGDGLTGSYYKDKNFSVLGLTRVDPQINFAWGSGSPDPVIPTDNFSVRWNGFIVAPASGTYTFYDKSDDGVRVWINNVLVIDHYVAHNKYGESSGTINLEPGTYYPIKIDYYDGWGDSVLELRWSGPGVTKNLIPTSALYTTVGGSVPSSSPTPAPTPTTSNVMFGAWVGKGVNTFGDLSGFENTVGQKVKIRHLYYSNESNETFTPQLPDVKTDPDKFAQYLQAAPLRPSEILLLSWASDDVTNPDTSNLPKVASGQADVYLDPFIDRWANTLASTPNEIWLNIYWEVNTCYSFNSWWCTPNQGATTFKAAYQRIVDKFRAKFASLGKTNVKYVWNVERGNIGAIADSYPGDNYVDLASFDAYDAQQSNTQPIYTAVKSAAPNKPVFIQETGQKFDYAAKATQIKTFFSNLASWGPDIMAVVWFDEPNGNSWDTIIGKSATYTQAFCDALYQNGLITLGAPSNSTCATSTPTPTSSPVVTPTPTPVPTPTVTSTPAPTPTPPSGGNGLNATYFKDKNLSIVGLTRIDPQISFDWGNGSPSSLIPTDNFSVRWVGNLQAPSSGTYTIYTKSDDGVRVWINNQLVIDRWDAHNRYSEQVGTVNLTSGSLTPIKVEYYEGWGDSILELRWSGPGVTKTIIPSSALSL